MTSTIRPDHQPPPPVPLAGPVINTATAGQPSSRWRVRLGLVARLAFVAAGIGLSFLLDGEIFAVVLMLFVLLLPFEKLYPRQKGQAIRRPLVTTDIAFALMNPVLNVIGVTVAVAIGGLSMFWLPGLALRPVIAALPPVALPVVAFVLFDFLGYWTHRWAHEVPFLWRFHAVHHSPEHMDWISGFRIHPFDGVLIAPAFVFLLAAGVDVEVTGVLAVLQIVLGIFFHANVRVRWRWLDRIVANPEFHHWHHVSEPDAVGHNYAPTLPQWDLLFGTFFMPSRASDRRPQHYGVDEDLPRHLFGLLVHPLRGARSHLRPRALLRGLRSILRGVRRSTFRRTHSVRRTTTTGCVSTNTSLFEPLPLERTPSRHEIIEF